MTTYLAFLRGINVGGKNKVAMPELRAAFEQEGFRDVRTYINSGNVIFTSDVSDILILQKQCSTLILQTFQLGRV